MISILYKIVTLWRGVFLLLAFVILSLLMLNTAESSSTQFKVIVTSKLLYPVQKVIQTLTTFKNIKDENDRLLRENAHLRLMNDQSRQAIMENRRFRNFLQFEQPVNYPVLYGEVIARDPSRLKSSLIINLGEKDSVSIDMPVFTPKGIVGKITKVMSNHSHVELLLDPSSKISVMENRSRTIGVLESDEAYSCYMSFPTHAEIFLGDTIITSGMGGLFPKGIAVGIVERIGDDDMHVLSRAMIKPFQNPDYIEEVFVLKKQSTRQLLFEVNE